MAEGGGTPGGNDNGGKGDNGTTGTGAGSKGNDNSNSSAAGAVGGGTPGGPSGGGGDPSTSNDTSDSDDSKTAPTADTTTTTTDKDPSKSVDTGYSFSGAIDASLTDTIASLSLTSKTTKDAAEAASFGAMPESFSSLASKTAVGHIGKAGLQGAMAGVAAKSGEVGFSVGLDALTDPTSVVSALSSFATKSVGMTTTSHSIGKGIGSMVGSAAAGPIGAAVGGLLGAIGAELSLDALDARENEMARDAMEDGLGSLSGRSTAASMSDLGFTGFTEGLNDPSLSNVDGYTAGAIGQAEATAEAAMSIGDPTAGIGVSTTGISGIDTSTTPGMDVSSAIGSSIANANNALDTAATAPDRSGELGSIGVTAASVDAQEASMNAFGANNSFTPTRSYGWLRAGLPVSVPSSPYRNSYWDGTRFVNMNDYRGFM